MGPVSVRFGFRDERHTPLGQPIYENIPPEHVDEHQWEERD